jgi:hypothetical protein
MRLKHMLAGAFALLTTLPADAGTNGTLMGTVYDPKGLVLPGARVTRRSQQSNLVRTVLANAEGEYVIALLPPGPTLRPQRRLWRETWVKSGALGCGCLRLGAADYQATLSQPA